MDRSIAKRGCLGLLRLISTATSVRFARDCDRRRHLSARRIPSARDEIPVAGAAALSFFTKCASCATEKTSACAPASRVDTNSRAHWNFPNTNICAAGGHGDAFDVLCRTRGASRPGIESKFRRIVLRWVFLWCVRLVLCVRKCRDRDRRARRHWRRKRASSTTRARAQQQKKAHDAVQKHTLHVKFRPVRACTNLM